MTRKSVAHRAPDLPLPQHVTRRGQVLQYRRGFPKELWSVTGRAAFAISLRTNDPRQAMRARPDAERRYHAKVDAARQALARVALGPLPMTRADAEAIAVRWFFQSVESADDFRADYVETISVDEALDDARWSAAEARQALAEGDLGDEQRLARCLREAAGLGREARSEALLVSLLGRAAIALHEVEEARLVGRYGAHPSDPFFGSAMAAPAGQQAATKAEPQGTPQRTLADLIDAYKRDKWAQLSGSTQRSYAPVLRLLESLIEPATPLSAIDRAAGRNLFEVVQRLPRGLGKLSGLAGLPILAAVAEGERQGLPVINPKTANDSYLAHLRVVFRWGVREGWLAANPLDGLTVRDTVRAADRRDPFGDKLAKVFGGPPWNPGDANPRGGPVQYWGPLIGLFHGMRLGEIAALRCDDVGEQRGIPTLTVREGKTSNARRTLPIHPELVRLGFLGMVSARRKAKAVQLWEGEGADSRGRWGRRLSNGFKAVLVERGIKSPKLTFHSLRHDFQDSLRAADLHGGQLGAYLAGRSQGGVEASYGSGYSVEAKAEAIAKVQFPTLLLSPPTKP